MEDAKEFLNKVPKDQLAAMTNILLMIPIGFVNFLVPGRTLRLIYCFCTGIAIQYNLYGSEIKHLLILAFFDLFVIKFVNRKYVGIICFIYSLTHNSFIHLHKFFFYPEAWSIDIAWIYMNNLLKYSGFAWSYQDGGDVKDNPNVKHNRYKREYKIDDFTYLEYFS